MSPKNDPRIFNTVNISKEKEFNKSIFTLCEYREGDKPPWTIQSKEMLHDNIKNYLS